MEKTFVYTTENGNATIKEDVNHHFIVEIEFKDKTTFLYKEFNTIELAMAWVISEIDL